LERALSSIQRDAVESDFEFIEEVKEPAVLSSLVKEPAVRSPKLFGLTPEILKKHNMSVEDFYAL
jgi:hypothetical protein